MAYAYTKARLGFTIMDKHRLIMQEILGRPLTRKEFVHHINGDKKDNRPENLEVISAREHNILHGCINLLPNAREKAADKMPKGEKHFRTKLTDDDIRNIRKSDETTRDIGIKYGLHHTAVSKIKRRVAWKHVTD